MKILYIDNQSIQNSIRIGLMEQMAGHEVYLIDDADKAVEYFVSESPEIVIADTSVTFSSESLKQILSINPSQKSIVLSGSIECSDSKGCAVCLSKYERKGMLKGRALHDLMYLIENFSEIPCEFAHIED